MNLNEIKFVRSLSSEKKAALTTQREKKETKKMEGGTPTTAGGLTQTLVATLMREKGGLGKLFSRSDEDKNANNALVVVGAAALSASSAMMLWYFAYKKSHAIVGKFEKKGLCQSVGFDSAPGRWLLQRNPQVWGDADGKSRENRFERRFGENVRRECEEHDDVYLLFD